MGIDLMASRRRIILNGPHLATPTPANPVSFSATLAAPLKSLECAFSPVQAGSGDPAPDNVRPISGWTGANIYIQDEYDPTAEPTLAVAFPAEAGTIYGGYIDPVRGVARAEWAAVDLGSLSWTYRSSNGRSIFAARVGQIKPTGSGSQVFTGICEQYRSASVSAVWVNNDISYKNIGVKDIEIVDNRFADASDFKTAVSGVQLVYELATPIDYPLTPAQLKTLKGANVIYTDLNGNVSPTFWTH